MRPSKRLNTKAEILKNMDSASLEEISNGRY